MNTFIRISFSTLLVFACFIPAVAQKQPIAGLNINSDLYSGAIRPSLGVTFERHFTKHSGLESGIFYRTNRFRGTYLVVDSVGSGIYFFVVSERFINIPLLYKYYSRKLNFSVGPLLDIYVGWKQKSSRSDIKIDNFNVHPNLRIGFLGKVSRSFTISRHCILEPEVRVGFLRSYNDPGVGIGIAGKYQF